MAGAVSTAAAVTVMFVGLFVLAMAFIAGRRLFNASHDLIWNLGFLSVYAPLAAFALAQKVREDRRKRSPDPSQAHRARAEAGGA